MYQMLKLALRLRRLEKRLLADCKMVAAIVALGAESTSRKTAIHPLYGMFGVRLTTAIPVQVKKRNAWETMSDFLTKQRDKPQCLALGSSIAV